MPVLGACVSVKARGRNSSCGFTLSVVVGPASHQGRTGWAQALATASPRRLGRVQPSLPRLSRKQLQSRDFRGYSCIHVTACVTTTGMPQPRRPHPFLERAAASGTGTARRKTTGAKVSAAKPKSAKADDKSKDAKADTEGKRKGRASPASVASDAQTTLSIKPKARSQVRERSRSPKARATPKSPQAQSRSAKPKHKSSAASPSSSARRGDRAAVPVALEWSHEYGAHAHMFKQPKDQSAGHVPKWRNTHQPPQPTSKAVVITRRARATPPGSSDDSDGGMAPGRLTNEPPATNIRSRSPRSRRSNSDAAARKASADVHGAAGAKKGRGKGSPPSGRSSASGGPPPRSMPRKWIEKNSADAKAKDTGTDAVVVRHEMYRGVFNLMPGLNGVRGTMIDEEFNLADSFYGHYTFKIRGPGMMGPYLEEHGTPPVGERSFLRNGGDCVVDMRSGREYWVEVFECEAENEAIKQKIDLVESEISRLTTVDAVARATLSVSPVSPGRRSAAGSAASTSSRGSLDTQSLSSLVTDPENRSNADDEGENDPDHDEDDDSGGDGDDEDVSQYMDGMSRTATSPVDAIRPPACELHFERAGAAAPLITTETPAGTIAEPEATVSEPSYLARNLRRPPPLSPPSSSSEPLSPLEQRDAPSTITPGVVIEDCESPGMLEARVAEQDARIKALRREALQKKLQVQQAEIAALERELNGLQ